MLADNVRRLLAGLYRWLFRMLGTDGSGLGLEEGFWLGLTDGFWLGLKDNFWLGLNDGI